jgi:uncharacterized membrane protein YkoI
MNLLVASAGFCAALFCGSARADSSPPHVCYSTAEAREKISAQGLSDPFRLLRAATRSVTAEIVGVKLCLLGETLVYEVSVLPRDGHVGHVFIDARNGEVITSRNRR